MGCWCCAAVRPHMSVRQLRGLLDSSAVAGIKGRVCLVDSMAAAVVAYAKKHRSALQKECAEAVAPAAGAPTDAAGKMPQTCGVAC